MAWTEETGGGFWLVEHPIPHFDEMATAMASLNFDPQQMAELAGAT